MFQRTDSAETAERRSLVCNAWGWPESLVLVGYMLLVALAVRWHEPWSDEAQAWLLARDMSWTALVSHGVRYEGSPALWHSLLWVLVRLHVSFDAMRWIVSLFAVAGTYILLQHAPFPRLLRLLLPFTFFLAYQDAAIARSYVLIAPLAFGAAAVLTRRRVSAIPAVLLIGLLANVSIHGFVLSLALGAVAWTILHRQRAHWRVLLPSSLWLLACWSLSVYSTFPPQDVNFPAGKNIEQSWSRLNGNAPAKLGRSTVLPGELTPATPDGHKQKGASAARKVLRIVALLTFPLSRSRLLALAAVAALCLVSLRSRGNEDVGWIALLPYGLMIVTFQSVYLAPRHAGMLFVAFLVTAWLAWPDDRQGTVSSLVLTGILLLLCLEQITWTGHAVWSDVHGPYSASRLTARFLRQRVPGDRVAGFYYHSIGVLPYFDHNIYENQPMHAYWLWSSGNRTDARAPFELVHRPDIVVVSGWSWGDNADVSVDWSKPDPHESQDTAGTDDYKILPFFLQHGYRETHRFCGHTWMRNGYAELLCDIVLEPTHA